MPFSILWWNFNMIFYTIRFLCLFFLTPLSNSCTIFIILQCYQFLQVKKSWHPLSGYECSCVCVHFTLGIDIKLRISLIGVNYISYKASLFKCHLIMSKLWRVWGRVLFTNTSSTINVVNMGWSLLSSI